MYKCQNLFSVIIEKKIMLNSLTYLLPENSEAAVQSKLTNGKGKIKNLGVEGRKAFEHGRRRQMGSAGPLSMSVNQRSG